MSEQAPDPTEPQPFDVRTIRHLVKLMQRYEVTSLDLVQGEMRIRLRRHGGELVPAPAAPAAGVPAPAAPAPTAAATPAPVPAAPAPAEGPAIESPMVGTFYAARSPDDPPYVSVGTAVRPDTTVCVIEAMKVFTEIPAGVSGVITEVLVQNAQPVEYGQPLFRVKSA
jgi:acetyl-CoA carboxylase biotin carboxyl carrier protein